jgi:ketosteroid isomerase-like protein
MSQENVEIARGLTTSPHAFFQAFDDFIVCDSRRQTPAALDFEEVVVGREAAIKAFRHWWGTFTEYDIEIEEYIDAGQSVIVPIYEWGTGKGSGVPIDRRHVQVWTFREGRIVRIDFYPSRAEALEAVGMRE